MECADNMVPVSRKRKQGFRQYRREESEIKLEAAEKNEKMKIV
jgi:hypothetical protein